MFDLQQSITAWRQQMLSAGIQTDALLDELESHLREEMARQMRSGMAAPEAFESAVSQIGSTEALRAEFAKVNSPTAVQWRRWGVIGYSLELVAYTVLQLRQLWRAEPSHQDLILGIIGLAVTLGVASAIWRLAPAVMGYIANQAVRSGIVVASCVSVVAWLVVFARFILPDLELTSGQFAVVFLWAMLPPVAFPAVVSGLDQGQRECA
ncbi:hypothetical protein CfE428DRAFT_4895 [Chthoniobacter flavus Ellin428]|uniref:Uncharacterized protein n=1 Tax=Chthoniobacter flavus Ellin428 TaxID=497964 RepID=B4D7I0_9BACT|nr:permease prefix domain 1-containing protein [Chthoniobacter flavus]EDY17597.1 hypothetical protein CfE428DRAFT_4895 [Chthoniobacter flavus Ellin428]TCO92374.1 hypothetical protein EV701_106143 [Chthoniobacter flavus]